MHASLNHSRPSHAAQGMVVCMTARRRMSLGRTGPPLCTDEIMVGSWRATKLSLVWWQVESLSLVAQAHMFMARDPGPRYSICEHSASRCPALQRSANWMQVKSMCLRQQAAISCQRRAVVWCEWYMGLRTCLSSRNCLHSTHQCQRSRTATSLQV